MSIGSSRLGGASKEYRRQLDESVHLLLLWVAESDGVLVEAERDFAAEQFPTEDDSRTDELLEIIRSDPLKPIEAALRFLANESRELRTAFLDMAIAMAKVDSEIAITENHLLRFYADALGLDEDILERRFKTISGGELSQPPNLGAPNSENDDSEGGSTSRRSMSGDMTPALAYAMLGVPDGATACEVDAAYGTLSQFFLIKRVEALGPSAISFARTRSRRLRDAYKLLRG